jgi:hypothetical protein
MEGKKVAEIIDNPQVKSNKDLESCLSFLTTEFDKTKGTIIELTKYLDIVENSYNKINEELSNRYGKR